MPGLSLEDPDETLKRKTLDLLYKMTNPKNVVFIVAKLIKHLRSSTDTFLRQELVARITELAERFSPDNEWFIKARSCVPLVDFSHARATRRSTLSSWSPAIWLPLRLRTT